MPDSHDDERSPLEASSRFGVNAASIVAVMGLLAVGVAFPIALGTLSGSLNLPSNDDPAYRRVALDLYSTGRLELNGWNAMTLIGQILFVQPFLWLAGGAAWAFTASTAVLASIGIIAGYALARRVLSVPRSALAVLGIVIFPGFVMNTTTYMTDVPAWAMSTACLMLGAIALGHSGSRRWLWLAASLSVGCFAFSIREFSIAAPVTVLLVFALSGGFRTRGYWIAVVATAGALAGIYLVATHLPGRSGIEIAAADISLRGLRRAFDNSLRHGFASVALVLSPALVIAIASWWRKARPLDVLIGLCVGLLAYFGPIVQIVHTGTWPQVVAGNLIAIGGSLDTRALYGTRPALFPFPWWYVINGAALILALVASGVCGAVVGAALRRAVRALRDGRGLRSVARWEASTWTLIVVFVGLYGAGLALWATVFSFFDRYTWPLIVPLYVILLRPPAAAGRRVDAVDTSRAQTRSVLTLERPRRWPAPVVAGVLVAGLASVSLTLLANYDAFTTARWQMGEAAAERGFPAGQVDAGFEWVADHATGSAVRNPPPGFGSGYEAWWPSFHLCALVSSSSVVNSRAQLVEVDTSAYRLMFFGGPWEPLYLYRITGPGCP